MTDIKGPSPNATCPKCGHTYNLSKHRNTPNIFICPDCCTRELARMRKTAPSGIIYNRFDVDGYPLATVVCEETRV